MRLAACVLLLLPVPALAATWVANPAACRLEFTGTQSGQSFRGRFTSFSARISFDPAQPQSGTADVTVDLASASTGDKERDGALPAPEWFDVKAFPQAVFHAASFRPVGGTSYQAVGTLSIRGVSVDVTLPFSLAITGDTAHATGHTEVSRSAFGVGQGPFATDQIVGFQVGIDVDLTAKLAP